MAPEESQWEDPRDEIDIDSQIDQALEEEDEARLPEYMSDLIRLMRFQGRHREAEEYEGFLPICEAMARRDWSRALFLLTEETDVSAIQPGVLLDKLLVALAERFEAQEQWLFALAAWTECDDDQSEDKVPALRRRLQLDDFGFEQAWNQEIFAHYQKRVEDRPEDADSWEVLALQYSLLDRGQQALEAAHKAVDLDATRQHAHQVIVESLQDRGDLEGAEAHLHATLERWPDSPWPRVALAEHYARHRDDYASARRHNALALELAPDDEDANELMCKILQRLEDWEALEAHMLAMVDRAEDRFSLYDLYDDLADLYESYLRDPAKAEAARAQASLYGDVWEAVEPLTEAFRKDPSARRSWRVLRGVLYETTAWNDLIQRSFERLDYAEDPSEINDIYEGLFSVLSQRMSFAPWDLLEAHLKERLEDTQEPALMLLLQHHLGWVQDQIALAQRGDDEPEPEEEEEDDDPFERARGLAFSYGKSWTLNILPLRIFLFLLTGGILFFALGGSMAWFALCWLVGGGLMATWGANVYAESEGPKARRCLTCSAGYKQVEFTALSPDTPEFQWAQSPEAGVIPFWFRCKACGFDSRAAYQPGKSGVVPKLNSLQSIADHLARARSDLPRPEGYIETAIHGLTLAWDESLALGYDAEPSLSQALAEAMLDEQRMPVLARVDHDSPLKSALREDDPLDFEWADVVRELRRGGDPSREPQTTESERERMVQTVEELQDLVEQLRSQWGKKILS